MGKVSLVVGLILVFAGTIFIINSGFITGFAVFEEVEWSASITIGFILFMAGAILIFLDGREDDKPGILERQIVIEDKINENKKLQKLSEEALRDQYIKRDVEHLKKQFENGNTNPGIGTKTLSHTDLGDIVYLRGRNGGRVFLMNRGNGRYELLSYAKGTGQGNGKDENERKVIGLLRQMYQDSHKEDYSSTG